MGPGLRLDQLCGQPHSIAGPPHAALENIAAAQFACELPHINRLSFVNKARIASDDGEPLDPGKSGNDILYDAVGEIFLFRVTAHVGERKHGDTGFSDVHRRPAVRSSSSGLRPRLQTKQAVSAARNSDDEALFIRSFIERLSQVRDVDLDIAVLDDDTGPDFGHQFGLGDDFAPGLCQDAKNVERPASQLDRRAVTPQFALPKVELKLAESHLVAVVWAGHAAILNN